jgi:hypothetical protein
VKFPVSQQADEKCPGTSKNVPTSKKMAAVIIGDRTLPRETCKGRHEKQKGTTEQNERVSLHCIIHRTLAQNKM